MLNKWEKANLAIQNGIDLVIEIPTVYATSSAANFANGALKILDSLKIIHALSFGTEINRIDKLKKVAKLLKAESEGFKSIMTREIRKHSSYPKALENSIIKCLGQGYEGILTSNNILAIEYLKSISKLKSTIIPLHIERIENNYNDKSIKEISSATAIRNEIISGNINSIQQCVPDITFKKLYSSYQSGDLITDLSVFEKEIIYSLRIMSKQEIAELPDVSEGLEDRIKYAANNSNNLDDLIEKIKSKRYTRTRIQRILIYCLLRITNEDMEMSKEVQPYVRILGFNENGKKLLSQIKKANPDINLVTSVKKFEDTCDSGKLLRLLAIDKMATNIYSLKRNTTFKSNQDYTTKLETL